jgi:hypothetical protein
LKVEKFEKSFNETINLCLKEFKDYYKNLIDDFEIIKDARANISFLSLIKKNFGNFHNRKLYVIIDEYDISLNSTLSTLLKVKKQENQIFKSFFSVLKEACQSYNTKVFITGVTPLVLSELSSGFNIAFPLNLDINFCSMYGFTQEDVKRLNIEKYFKKNIENKQVEELENLIFEKLWKENNGYCFAKKKLKKTTESCLFWKNNL